MEPTKIERVNATESGIDETLKGIPAIIRERQMLRRAVEWANIEMDGNESLTSVLELTTPAKGVD